MPVFIGTSGWQYRHWRNRFYPAGLPQRAWLEHYAERWQTVESNNAFYRLPERATFEDWARRTPDDFKWTVKVSRYLTHMKRLRAPEEPVARFLDHARGLGEKLGPVLLQLPPDLKANLPDLRAVLGEFGSDVRVAVEFRHDSWFTSETRQLLEENRAALCLADRGSRLVSSLWRTADWGYVRLHEGRARPQPCYGRGALGSWALRIARLWGPSSEVYFFFNNDGEGCAPRDARAFAGAARRAGLDPSRSPTERVRVE